MSGTLPMKELQVVIDEVKARLSHRPKLAKLFENCYPNTLATTTKILEDGSTFVFTGDIPAMWLRDSSAQVRHYIGAAKPVPGGGGADRGAFEEADVLHPAGSVRQRL